MFFSDRELPNKKTKLGEEITYTVWGGIYAIYCKYLANNNFAKDFPLNCPDGNGIYGVDRHLLEISAKSLIPNLPDDINVYFRVEELNPFLQFDLDEEKDDSWKEKTEQYKMAVLDFVEFLCLHICDVENGNYHSFFNHYELIFKCTNNAREQFIQEINLLFRRNELAFLSDDGGRIRRVLPYAISDSIVHRPTLNDVTTNELISPSLKTQ